jgi:hypothetical protein
MSNKYAEAIASGHYCTLWVCTDCLFAHEYAEAPTEPTGYEPLCKITDPADDLSTGLLDQHHADGCTRDIRDSEGCECEEDSFSSRWCDGCGCPLAGTRHAMTLVYGVRA